MVAVAIAAQYYSLFDGCLFYSSVVWIVAYGNE